MKKPYRTILIDDHQLFNDGLSLILNNSPDFTVVAQVVESQLACDACDQHRPDLVLVDFNMPNLDGLAVVAQIRQLPFRCRLVVVSMYAEQPEIARFMALNVDGYLAKTIPAGQLLESLQRVMQRERVFLSDKLPVRSTLPPRLFLAQLPAHPARSGHSETDQSRSVVGADSRCAGTQLPYGADSPPEY